MSLNIMMDPKPMFPKLFHPVRTSQNMKVTGYAKYFTRTSHPVKYYFIDFGISSMYPADDPHPREQPILSGDKSAPEYGNPEPCDSYALDIYLLGNVVRQNMAVCFLFCWYYMILKRRVWSCRFWVDWSSWRPSSLTCVRTTLLDGLIPTK